MHERRYSGDIGRLRSFERQSLLEVERVVELCLDGITLKNMLDVGTASGLFASSFANRGLEISGIDVDPQMILTAAEYIPEGSFTYGLAEKIPFEDATFDLVFMGLVWHETDDRLKALKEARRSAKLRVAILEWPYVEGIIGPPLSDRINPTDAEVNIKTIGFKTVETIKLANTVLYRMDL